MEKRYAVVFCSDCSHAKIIETIKKTMTCPHCNRKHKIVNLKKHFETNSQEKARSVIGYLNAKQDGKENIFIDIINNHK